MSLSATEIKQIKDKVLYSELDRPFHRYVEKVNDVTKLCHNILEGNLKPVDSQDGNSNQSELNSNVVQDLSDSAELRFIEAQASIDSKKIAFENWQQENDKVKDDIEHNVEPVLSELGNIRDRLRSRITNLRTLYDNIKTINGEYEALSTGKTTLEVTREEWEKELGKDVTDKLIDLHYLKVSTKSRYTPTYHVYDDFSKGPKEVKRLNKSMKGDIAKLDQELGLYKQKWLKDADVFSKITGVLQDELAQRNMDIAGDENMDGNADSEEEDEEQDARDERLERHVFLDGNSDGELSASDSGDVDMNEHEDAGTADYNDDDNDNIDMDDANVRDEAFVEESGIVSNQDKSELDEQRASESSVEGDAAGSEVISQNGSPQPEADTNNEPDTPISRTSSSTDIPDDDNTMEWWTTLSNYVPYTPINA